ncbi:MAG TPA: hypothetical protein VM299_03485 [Solirubrobacteraceae bacterium]|jgi:uncharacterized protein|nr:hypothetical protein [Solirubrobacteraceae bacterium]
MTVILAAAPIVACADAGDPRCGHTQGVLMAETGPYVLPGPVPEQIDALLAQRVGQHARRAFLKDLAAGRFRVERLTSRDVGALERLEREYASLELGLAELAIVVVAARLRCTRIVTFDEQPLRSVRPLYGDGFTLLPSDS